MCGKDRKESANVHVSGSREPQPELASYWFEHGCYKENALRLSFIPDVSLPSCLIFPRFDSCFAEILALLGTSNSLLTDLQEITVETQQCTSCAAFVIMQ